MTPRHVTMAVVTRGHGPERRSDTAAAATAEMEHGDSELVARQQAEPRCQNTEHGAHFLHSLSVSLGDIILTNIL